MLHLLRRGAGRLETVHPGEGWQAPADAIWIDLTRPSRAEELAVERALGVELPTREEMAAIEPSSRLYQEAGATFMTATLLAHSGEQQPRGAPVTFVLVRGLLVTIRYDDLRAFSVYGERAPGSGVASGTAVLMGLLDAIVERLADRLEETAAQVQEASGDIFRQSTDRGFQPLLRDLARVQSVTSTIRASLVSLGRLLSFAALAREIAEDPECNAHLRSVQTDVQSLTEHSAFQSNHITFLLDAALGLISTEQNAIIKWFSVYAVIFLPPTLLASIWGMNFHHMPELDEPWAYPVALGLMVVAAVVPLLWFKRRGLL